MIGKHSVKRRKKRAFSKTLLVQESAQIWVITICYIVLAFYCVSKGYTASLPWLSVLPGVAWGAYGLSQKAYYDMATSDHSSGGLTHAITMAKINTAANTTAAPEETDRDA